MRLNEVFTSVPNFKKPKRVGRGIGCTKGKTCGRGVKGQKSRTGVAIKGFEGGQNPIHTRLPKRGFNNIFAEKYEVINFKDVERVIASKKVKAGDKLDKQKLVELGIIRKAGSTLKLLASGELSIAVSIEFDMASKKALEILEKSGSSKI